MSLLELVDIKKTYGDESILADVHAKIFKESKIGLVGANGCGKTTLFKIIAQLLEADSGKIIRRNGLNVRHLAQIPDFSATCTVMEEALKGFDELVQMEKRLEKLQEEMSHATDSHMEEIIASYDTLREEFEKKGGYRYHGRTQAVLQGLGFSQNLFSFPVKQLSGGQKNRLALARTLISPTDLLLLDEPTNFLDLTSVEWLEEELRELPCAYVVISHDRYFLNQIANEIWELSFGKLRIFKGNYHTYEKNKEKDLLLQEKAYQMQQAEIKRQEEFIVRNIYGQKHRQAQSRRKKLEKLEKIEAPPEKSQQMKLAITPTSSGSTIVLRAEDLGHRYGEKRLFSGLTCSLFEGEKMAIIGPNGCGKSTLLHTITGKLIPTEGSITLGKKMQVGFYHQELEGLVATDSVFESVKKIVPTMNDAPLRSYLARFLFQGDEIYKKVGSLSGGEKSKVALAQLIIKRPNFLILDEPTNHLDIISRQALEIALNDFEGTVLFVSHDRYFINEVASRLLVYHNQQWINFYGDYDLFVTSKKNILPETEKKKQEKEEKKGYQPPVRRKKKKKYTLEELEQKIMEGETKLEEISNQMISGGTKMKELKQEYEELTAQLAQWNEEWESWE